jgi:hypothetical protein
MIAFKRVRLFYAGLTLTIALSSAALAAPTMLASLDLSKSFHTRSVWTLQETQRPNVVGTEGDQVDGVITLCLRKGIAGACDQELLTAYPDQRFRGPASDIDLEMLFSEPHGLEKPVILFPKGENHAPLLWVQTYSASSTDGNTSTFTQVLTYNRTEDRFFRIYDHLSEGSNNDQEIRFIDAGPMRGDIISVDPTSNAPFAFWIVVNALTPSLTYHEVLRYRSATRYGDGNMLSVIDSDMPNIQRRLGLWRIGLPLPIPASGCSQPRIIHDELWCY